jgi:DNA-binding CsgD family transcriptional regulator
VSLDNDKSPDGHVHLTRRQTEIIALVASGLSDKEIARRLGLSPRTVQAHLDRVFQELGLHKRSAAVATWLRYRANNP